MGRIRIPENDSDESRIFSRNNVSYLKLPAEQEHDLVERAIQSRPRLDVSLVAIFFPTGISAHVSRDLS